MPKHHAMKTLDSEGTAPLILNLGTRWGEWSASRSVRFTLRKEPRYPLNRLGGSQSRSDVLESSISPVLARITPQFLVRAAPCLVTTPTEPSRLPQYYYNNYYYYYYY